jgi:hypothetical protein
VKTLTKVFLILCSIFIALFLVAPWSVQSVLSPERDEVMRTQSPSGDLQAVLFETNGGATTSFGYEVYLEGKGIRSGPTKAASIYGAIRNNKGAHGVTPRWISDDELHVEYYSSRKDEVVAEIPRTAGKPIRVQLKLNVNDLAAPSGGMLWNLKK